MTIIPDDFTFATSDPRGLSVPYGSAGDCFSASVDPRCRKGQFSIDLTGTGVKVSRNVRWTLKSEQSNIGIYKFLNKDGIKISAKCGGWCGHCKPTPNLRFQLQQCKVQTGF